MKRYSLLVDTTNQRFILILSCDNAIIDVSDVDGLRKTNELFRPTLETMLMRNGIDLKDVDDFYIIIGPGSYTGIKIGLAFVKVVKVLHPAIRVYAMNSLLWQTQGRDAISMLDARSNQHYFAVCKDKHELIPAQVIDRETCLTIAQSFPNCEIIEDYQNFEPRQAFDNLREFFVLVDDVEHLEPLYIRPAVR